MNEHVEIIVNNDALFTFSIGLLSQNSDKMRKRCVVYGCGLAADAEKGISIHVIPFYNDNRPEAVTRRKRWVNFSEEEQRKMGTIKIVLCMLTTFQT